MASFMDKLQVERGRAARTSTSTTALRDMLAALGDTPNLDHVADLGGKIALSAAWGELARTIPACATRQVIFSGARISVTKGDAARREADLDDKIGRTLRQYTADAQDAFTLGLAQAARPLADIVD